MNQLCSNFRCQIVQIVLKLNTRRDEIGRVEREAQEAAAVVPVLGLLEIKDTHRPRVLP